jgi:ribokinase
MQMVVAGNITIDDMVMPDGKVSMGVCGGDVLYSALGARFWLKSVGMLTRTGEDFDNANLEKCEAANIDTAGVRRYPGESVRNWVIYEYNGDRHFIYRTAPERLDLLSPEPADIPNAYLDAECFFIAAMPVGNQLSLAKFLKGKGRTVLLDPYEEDASNNRDDITAALAYVDIFMPSEEEEKRFFGNSNHEENIRKFSAMGPPIVVIKLGSAGCMVYDRLKDRISRIPVYDTPKVDPTGAGDAFCGGFTAGYCITGDPVTSAMYGTVSASFAIEGFGSLQLFNRKPDEAEERLKAMKTINCSGR